MGRPALILGRSRTCDVVLEDPSVSALHAEIRMGVSLIELVDLGNRSIAEVVILGTVEVFTSMNPGTWYT